MLKEAAALALLDLLTDYVFRTQPTVDFSVLLLMIQLFLQSAAPAMLLFSAVNGRPPTERLLLLMCPMVFFLTYGIMDLLLGGSFLGGGFRHIPELVLFLLKPRLAREVWGVLALFPLLFFPVRRWGRANLFSVLGDLTSWALWGLAAAVAVLIAREAVFPGLLGLPPGTVALWYVYALYTLLAQEVLNLTALGLHLLFRERPPKGDLDALVYDPQWAGRQVRRLLLEGHKVFLCSMGPLLLLLCALLIPAMVEEGFSVGGAEFLIFMAGFGGWWGFVLFRVLFPDTLPAWKRVQGWSDSQRLCRLFCQEYYNDAQPPRRGQNAILTAHFLLDRSSLRPGLYYLPFYQGWVHTRQGRALAFADGAVLLSGRLGPKDGALLAEALDQCAPTKRSVSY